MMAVAPSSPAVWSVPCPIRCAPQLAGALTALLATLPPLLLQSHVARASNDLNPAIETMCEGLAVINEKVGATAAPGTPMGERMEVELVITAAQYEALWTLMKFTPTPSCESLY